MVEYDEEVAREIDTTFSLENWAESFSMMSHVRIKDNQLAADFLE